MKPEVSRVSEGKYCGRSSWKKVSKDSKCLCVISVSTLCLFMFVTRMRIVKHFYEGLW